MLAYKNYINLIVYNAMQRTTWDQCHFKNNFANKFGEKNSNYVLLFSKNLIITLVSDKNAISSENCVNNIDPWWDFIFTKRFETDKAAKFTGNRCFPRWDVLQKSATWLKHALNYHVSFIHTNTVAQYVVTRLKIKSFIFHSYSYNHEICVYNIF
jgi:hypothetical protein